MVVRKNADGLATVRVSDPNRADEGGFHTFYFFKTIV